MQSRNAANYIIVALLFATAPASAQDAIPIHEAVESGKVKAQISDLQREVINLYVTGEQIEVMLAAGTWIELANGKGRLYLRPVSQRMGFRVDPQRGAGLNAVLYPDKVANVPPVIQIGLNPPQAVTKIGVDPLAARIFEAGTYDNKPRMETLCAILMIETPGLTQRQAQIAADRVYNRPIQRRTRNFKYEVTADHITEAEALLERSRFMLAVERGEAPDSASATLADAIARKLITAELRIGQRRSAIIVHLKRTAAAPSGPMMINIPRGTVIELEDNNGPLKIYPLADEPVFLFGDVASNAQIPVIYGMYKRYLRTTPNRFAFTASFDETMARLMIDRDPSEYAYLAIESLLHNKADLTPQQISYHLGNAAPPLQEGPLPAVTPHVIQVAKSRLAGDTDATY